MLTLQNALLFQAWGGWELAKYIELCSEKKGVSIDEKASQFYNKKTNKEKKGKKEKETFIKC